MDTHNHKNTVFLGINRYRGEEREIGIYREDRRQHMYIIGKTGTGKTTLMAYMIEQDIKNGEGVAVFDPHGDFVQSLLEKVPEHRRQDLIYFDAPNPNSVYGFNPVAGIPQDRRAFAASAMIESFRKMWEDSWGSRMEHVFRNALMTLLDQPHATLADVDRLFYDEDFRNDAVGRITNPRVRDFWLGEFAGYTPSQRAQVIAPIQNKLGAFLADPNLQRILTKPRENIDLRKIIDSGKILLVNLAKGKLGGDNSSLLGSLLVSRIGLAALSRADQKEETRKDFYLYLDEFQNFTTLSIADMLAELRKYRCSLILAHQYLSQLDTDIRDAILGNVGTMLSFRVGVVDASLLEKEFAPKVAREDLLNLSAYHMYIRMMVKGRVSQTFNARTISPHGEEKKESISPLLPLDDVVKKWDWSQLRKVGMPYAMELPIQDAVARKPILEFLKSDQ